MSATGMVRAVLLTQVVDMIAAKEAGLVLTIETVPRVPLAMGNFDMVAHVREAR